MQVKRGALTAAVDFTTVLYEECCERGGHKELATLPQPPSSSVLLGFSSAVLLGI